jgi:hypothetical protein
MIPSGREESHRESYTPDSSGADKQTQDFPIQDKQVRDTQDDTQGGPPSMDTRASDVALRSPGAVLADFHTAAPAAGIEAQAGDTAEQAADTAAKAAGTAAKAADTVAKAADTAAQPAASEPVAKVGN